jgi:hypothetical protein
VEVDSGVTQDYTFQLAQALQDLRRQHEEQVSIYKEELGNTFQAKVCMMSDPVLPTLNLFYICKARGLWPL